MSHIYKILQYLSIDVAIGSMGSSIVAVKALHAKLPVTYWVLLPMCVWIIYTADHLMDAFKLKEKAISGRHRFHVLHHRGIGISLFFAGLLCIALVLASLDRHLAIYGLCISLFILAYLLTNHWASHLFRFFPREFIIAIGYMAGTWGAPLLSQYPLVSRAQLWLLFSHFLIIISIPLLYSIYEYEADTVGGFISFSTAFGVKLAEIASFVVLTLSIAGSVGALILYHSNLSILLILMALYLFAVQAFRKNLSANEHYRAVGDAVNFLPFTLFL